MLVLGIETSCDETSIAVVKDGNDILANEVLSSVRIHEKYGGIIPEIASRQQLEYILYVLESALGAAEISLDEIDVIAVTKGPGLIGSLLIGIQLAKALALKTGKPVVGVNHLAAHAVSAMIHNEEIEFPFVALVVSGGHTSLVKVDDFDKYKLLGQTRDDACGEAYDKVAKILNLGYPGGPAIEGIAKEGDPGAYKFNCGKMGESLDFSFSGIKTAVLNTTNHDSKVADIAASFQESVINELVNKSVKALEKTGLKTLLIGGGVSVNKKLRDYLERAAEKHNFQVVFPEKALTQDNAAMIAGLGYHLYKKGYQEKLDFAPDSNLNF